MATIRRYRVLWGGLGGLPGYSLFYATSAAAAGAALKTFFTTVATTTPAPLQFDIPISGDTLDDATGTLNGGWVDVGGGVVASGSSVTFAAGVGAYVRWNTGAIVGGRRLRGRTFICPLASNGYDSSGTIATSYITTLSTAANTLAATGLLVTWHRPTALTPGGGSSSLITSAAVPDQVTSLRSRRY